MNTQNTTLHIKLWHREFWLMAFANLLLTMAVYMLVPTLPLWMLYEEGMSAEETGVAMGIFALGIVLPGPFCSYLVQRYRRNMVCVWAIAALAAGIFFMGHDNGRLPTSFVYGLRLLMGAAFGLAQRSSSTPVSRTGAPRPTTRPRGSDASHWHWARWRDCLSTTLPVSKPCSGRPWAAAPSRPCSSCW